MTVIDIPTPDPRTLPDDAQPFAEAVSSRYSIKRELGRGGMGVVYLARDQRLDRLVAIKTLPQSLAQDPVVRERFLRETRTAGAMAHPNIVPIHGADEADGHVYFVMAFVDGDSLASHIRAHQRLAPGIVAGYLRDVAAALAHAHLRGIIHRDIKAENVLVDRDTQRAMITDFGIARIAEATPLTVTGQLLGTVHYVSPEQVSGTLVDGRSDLYSLGIVGFLALTGEFPFNDDVASAVLVSHVTKTAPPVASVNRGVPASLATIIDRCLMKNPAHRYATADDLVAALDVAVHDLERASTTPISRVTDTEAHAVWKRAAELQAMTGIQPRPEPVARPRDPAKNRSGNLGVPDVRAAAIEAGIDDTYVEHALVEHGLLGDLQVTMRDTTVLPPVKTSRRWWRKISLVAQHSSEVAGELSHRDFDRLLNVLRDETGVLGHTTAKTRELGWWTGRLGTRLEVSIVPTDDRTSIHLAKSVQRSTLLAGIVTFVTVGPASGLLVGASLLEMWGNSGEDFAIFFGLATAATASIWVTRRVARRLHMRADNRLRQLGDRLADKVRVCLPRTTE